MKTPFTPNQYPAVQRSEHVETFQSALSGKGVEVPDPYVDLQDPLAPATKEFVRAQGAFAQAYLDQNCDAERFSAALAKNWDYARYSLPARKGDGNYYFTYNSGLQAQSALYRFPAASMPDVRAGGDIGELFFDPNLLSTDGSVSRSSSSFSKDGQYFAYALSRSGSDWTNIYIRPTASPHSSSQAVGQDEGKLDDVLRYVKFSSIAWTADSLGFFYQRFPARESHGAEDNDAAGTEIDADLNAALYYHRVGTAQAADVLVIVEPNHPERMFSASATEDGRYIVASSSQDTARSNLLWIADLHDGPIGPDMKWNKIVNEFGEYYSELANDGPLFYFYTNAGGASNYKIQTYNLAEPEKGFVDLVAHKSDALLSSVHIADNDKLVLLYSIDVKDEIWLHDLKSGARGSRIGEGLIGTIDQISGRREDRDFYFSLTGFSSPGTSYNYDFSKPAGERQSLYREIVVAGLNASDFVTEQVFFKSKDGTKVPMFITSHKDVKRDGTAPAIQYGYGGFSHSMDPFFSPSLLTWVQHYRGVLAVVNLRGGSEYGEDWHLAGTKERKQNVFDDFQWATKYLVEHKIAAKDKVAISGGSNGGLLVAACVNQAPELYGAAICDVGVLDMLRFQRFTIGRAWTSDYGNADVPAEFDYLIKYSPLHNIPGPSVVLPPLMLLTGDHDDRVSPLHSFKHAAQLQYQLPNNPNPLLLRVDAKAGHGAGKSTQAKILEATEKYGFVSQSMGLTWVD